MLKTFYINRNLFPRLNVTLISTNKKIRKLNYPISFGEWKILHSKNNFISILNDPEIANKSTVINKIPLTGVEEAYIRIDDDIRKYYIKLNPMNPYVITKLNDDLDEVTFFKIS